jgi:hypothetical protein
MQLMLLQRKLLFQKKGNTSNYHLRILSLDQKQARGGMPQSESVPHKKVVLVIGTYFSKPLLRTNPVNIQQEVLLNGIKLLDKILHLELTSYNPIETL